MLFHKTKPLDIDDPAGYLKRTRPDLLFKKVRSVCIDEDMVPAYVMKEYNGCAVNGAASLVAFALGEEYGRSSFREALDLCRKVAENGYSKIRNGVVDYYIKLGTEAPYIRKCLRAASLDYRAASSLFVKKRAIREILAGRPVLLNIGLSRQYFDHTITAYGFEEYAESKSGRKRLFFKVRDAYTHEERYFEYRCFLGISITYLKM